MWGSMNGASNNVTNILMEADTFPFMQAKHLTALEEEGGLMQPDGEKRQGAAEEARVVEELRGWVKPVSPFGGWKRELPPRDCLYWSE